MEPSKTLPSHYVLKGTLDINNNLPVMLLLNLVGLVLLLASGWLVLRAAFWLRPAEAGPAFSLHIQNGIDGLKLILAVLLITVGMLILHEAIHGLFFWLFTGSRPKFGIGPGYAFAAAPEWYLPRNLYFIVGIAPLVLITLMGLILLAIAPPAWFLSLLALISFNISGAVGDLAVAVWLIKQPPTCLACDSGSSVTLYTAK
jgi:hypothetical protein